MDSPCKERFITNINADVEASEDFFKKIYGYSFCDKDFLNQIAIKLVRVGRKELILAYNNWFVDYKKSYYEHMKEVSTWFLKECSKRYEQLQRNNREIKEELSEGWKPKQKELLLKQKKLLLMKKLQELTES
ncbi:hypothetical protein [[Clostridium] fimetarium]|uniref:hypothetical protein n=1 Tax=[Clostridium] fimetarium TaxID=99656 RepID=UPI000B824CB2|nr:hypothetical protein [[Clostridium] fimetarium]